VDSITDLNAAAKIRIIMARSGLEIKFNNFTQLEITDGCLRNTQYHHHQKQQQK
jgi:hypothetical protein